MHMVCHDQEPLSVTTASFLHKQSGFDHKGMTYVPNPDIATTSFKKNLDAMISVYDHMILVHSERQSAAVERLATTGLLPVYYWSHALIAQDWYRYAQHDPELDFVHRSFDRDFLVYNRAWSGTREYRLKFAELIVQYQLLANCSMRFNPEDNGLRYDRHRFANSDFGITLDLSQYFDVNTADASASADYDAGDYSQAGTEVVLETLFDDTRHHLTEKTLRPLACGKPFLLAASAGSLSYLHSYGFETFDPWIDESYDLIQDPVQRLHAIAQEMKRLATLSPSNKSRLWRECHRIAWANKQRFFSEDFLTQVTGEFRSNFDQAMQQAQLGRSGWFFRQWLQAQASAPDWAKELGTSLNLVSVPSQESGGGTS